MPSTDQMRRQHACCCATGAGGGGVRGVGWGEAREQVTSSVTVVQFMVHSSGSHEPVASQKGLTAPEGSSTGLVDSPNRVPEVPRDITQVPS